VTEYGITISGSGVPIERASDYQRILDSRWKTASIVMSVRFAVDNFQTLPTFTKVLDHNLGYIPAFEAPFFNTTYEVQGSLASTYLFVADNTSIWFVNESPGTSDAYKIDGYINVYDINMEVDFESEPTGLVAAPKRGNIGVKIVGNGKYSARNANDSDPLGFSLSTDAKGIGIARIATLNSRGGVPFTIPSRGIIKHGLPYPPLVKLVNTDPYLDNFLVTKKPPSTTGKFYGPLRLLGATGVRVETGQLVVETSYVDNDTYRYVMFRDPVEIAG